MLHGKFDKIYTLKFKFVDILNFKVKFKKIINYIFLSYIQNNIYLLLLPLYLLQRREACVMIISVDNPHLYKIKKPRSVMIEVCCYDFSA
jgi:hypothetical protein